MWERMTWQLNGVNMGKHYNRSSETAKRRTLRKNQTYAEKIMWIYLRNRRFAGLKFRRQYSVDYFVIDFFCPELKLAIELDGEYHKTIGQKEYDLHRQKYIEEYGIKFIRFTNEEFLGNPNKAFEKLETTVQVIYDSIKYMTEKKE